MVEDIRFQLNHVTANGSATYSRMVAPYKCTLRNIIATLQGDPGDATTFTITDETDSVTLGTITFGSTLSAGDTVAYVPNTSTGDTAIASGNVILITCSSASDAAVNVHMNIELDPHARAA